MTKLKILLVVALLVGVVGAFPGAAALSVQAPAPDPPRPIVDPEVWTALTGDPGSMVAFRAETVSGEVQGLEGVFEVLHRAGSINTFAVASGENGVYAEGSGSAVRFLATWPSVTDISLTEEDDTNSEGSIEVQSTDAVLATGVFSGMVTAADGTGPLDGIDVRAYRQKDPTTWTLEATVQTTGDGSYEAIGLQPGFYRARFEDPAGEYGWEYYDDKPSFSSADKFEIEDGGTATGIDAALARAGRIAGTVTAVDGGEALADISVSAWYSTTVGWHSAGSARTESDGTFDLGGVPEGTYRVLFRDVLYDLYVDEVYDNLPYEDPYLDSLAAGDPVEVTAGITTSNIDAELTEAGHIAGTVTAVAGGDPLAGIVVSAWYGTTAGWQLAGSVVTSEDGEYDLGGLPPGPYRVRFADASSPPDYVSEVYEDASSLDDGTDVSVTAAATTTDIDAALVKYGRVTGSVYGEDGTTPLEGIYADVYAWNAESLSWERASRGITDATGAYEAGELDTGDYRVQFSDPTGQYATEVYDDQDALDSGDDVHVELGEETANIDAELDLGPMEFEVFLPLVLR